MDQFLGELRRLGIRPSPSYSEESECNGVMAPLAAGAEGGVSDPRDSQTNKEALQVIGEFIERHSWEWLIERHGHRISAEIPRALTRRAVR